ncbi:ribosomal L7Ae/L30e/S12e/Gadd45 family protein, partial [archaeon]
LLRAWALAALAAGTAPAAAREVARTSGAAAASTRNNGGARGLLAAGALRTRPVVKVRVPAATIFSDLFNGRRKQAAGLLRGARPSVAAAGAGAGAVSREAPSVHARMLRRRRASKRVTKLRKQLLTERVNRWLSSHAAGAAAYAQARAERMFVQEGAAAAAASVRAEIRRLITERVRTSDERRRQRMIDRGKLLPSGAPLPGGRTFKPTLVTKRMYRRMRRELINSGAVPHPATAAAEVSARLASEYARVLNATASSASSVGVCDAVPHGSTRRDSSSTGTHSTHMDDPADRRSVMTGGLTDSDAPEATLPSGVDLTAPPPPTPVAQPRRVGVGASEVEAGEALGKLVITNSVKPRAVSAFLARKLEAPHPAALGDSTLLVKAAGGKGGLDTVRPYMEQDLRSDLDEVVLEMVSTLYYYEQRTREDTTKKGSVKRRLLTGLREVRRAAANGKAKAIVIAPNVQQDELLTSAVRDIIALARAAQPPIPIWFAASRKRLGAACG